MDGVVPAEAGEPAHLRLGSEPGDLALGVLAGPGLAFADGLFDSEPPFEHVERLLIAERLQRFGMRGEAGAEQRLGFFEESAGKQRNAAVVEALVEQGAVWREAEFQDGESGEAVAGERLDVCGGAARDEDQL